MGMYINPPNCTKEEWLEEHRIATQLDAPYMSATPSDCAWICLVQNPQFTAAAVAFDLNELLRFAAPYDVRPKRWYLCRKDDIKTVIPEWEQKYL